MLMPKSSTDHEDEQHRKFREALEAKKAQQHAHAKSAVNKGVADAHNDKQQREFRRKSG
jgi:hypothetical protein